MSTINAPLRPDERRIAVIGTTGSGKTTLARSLAERLDLPLVELDAFYWGPNWTPTPPAAFRAAVDQATREGGWVVDGIHHEVRDLVWRRASTILWLDYPFSTILGNLSRRTWRRIRSGEQLWQGNRETLRHNFLTRVASRTMRRALPGRAPEVPDGDQAATVPQAMTAHRRRRGEFEQALARPEWGHLRVIRFQNARDAQRWLDALPPGPHS